METRSKRVQTMKQKQTNQTSSNVISDETTIKKSKIIHSQITRKSTKIKKIENHKRPSRFVEVPNKIRIGEREYTAMCVNDTPNGLIIAKTLIPEELWTKIFCYVDRKTLLDCQLVCKQWHYIVKEFVWHKKAKQKIGRTLILDRRTYWVAYYCMCTDMHFNKNLVKNHSGEQGLQKYWEVPPFDSIEWSIESPPVPPLPADPSFDDRDHCYLTSFDETWKFQIIDLIKEGFSKYLLDYLQPVIKISEWYCSENVPALYVCNVELIKYDGDKKLLGYRDDQITEIVYNHYKFSKKLENGEQNQWFKFEHELKNYGRGLRKIKFIHGGKKAFQLRDDHAIRGGYVKLARACVKVEMPSLNYDMISALPKQY